MCGLCGVSSIKVDEMEGIVNGDGMVDSLPKKGRYPHSGFSDASQRLKDACSFSKP